MRILPQVVAVLSLFPPRRCTLVLAGVFAGMGILVLGVLVLCWKRYWVWVKRGRELCTCGDEDLVDDWHWRYHWCLLLMPIFLGLAAFCVVLHWTEEWSLWFQIPLSALSGALVLLGSGWLGYGPVREYVLPLEDALLRQK